MLRSGYAHLEYSATSNLVYAVRFMIARVLDIFRGRKVPNMWDTNLPLLV